jgi:AAA15 family ATPase/GTPase
MLENESVNKSFRKDQIDVRVFQFLKQIGTGVEGYRQIEFELSEAEKSLRNVVNAKLREEFGEKFGEEVSDSSRGKSYRIEFEHKTSKGDSLYFGLERLSLGTRRLLLLLNMVFRALDQGSLLLIDEIDAGLHTLAAGQLIQLFSDKRTNPNGAQMIAATHDPNLLNAPCLRRDQIWFCEKDDGGSTNVFPLSDIKSRTTDDFEQGYLQGRYGAIPFSGDLLSLVGAK